MPFGTAGTAMFGQVDNLSRGFGGIGPQFAGMIGAGQFTPQIANGTQPASGGMSLGQGLETAGGIMNIGAGVASIFGAIGQAEDIKTTAALNQALAEEQAASIARRGKMERAAIRKGRAGERGSIRSAAAASGVEETGSVLKALEINAEERAQDEFVSEMNQLTSTNAALGGARLSSALAGPAGTAAIVSGGLQGFAAGIRGASQIAGARK